jgi:hypothetical protein
VVEGSSSSSSSSSAVNVKHVNISCCWPALM